MHINDYQFGSITIDGVNYSYDLELRSMGDILMWQRAQGHVIDADDVRNAIEQNPDLIIIGTGFSGAARLTEKAKHEIESNKIKLMTDKTKTAIKIFNSELERGTRVIGLFHLTC